MNGRTAGINTEHPILCLQRSWNLFIIGIYQKITFIHAYQPPALFPANPYHSLSVHCTGEHWHELHFIQDCFNKALKSMINDTQILFPVSFGENYPAA